MLQTLAKEFNKKWFRVRLFTLVGSKEDSNWLLPFAINKMLANENIDLTKYEQRYDYLFVEDFCKGIILLMDSANSGIYNLSSNSSIQLKEILLDIKNIIKPNSKLNFGELEYRENQVLHMEGDSTKFYKTLSYNPDLELTDSVRKTIEFYKNHFNKK